MRHYDDRFTMETLGAALDGLRTALHPDRETMRAALVALLAFVPEGGWNMKRDKGPYSMYSKGDEQAALATEACTYNLCGKDQGRSLLVRLRKVCEACGFDYDQVRAEALKDDDDN